MTPQAQPQPPSLSHKLMLIVGDLTSVLEDEVSLLEKRDYKRHPEILRRKQELTLNYQTSLKSLGDGPGKSQLNTQEKEGLAAAGQKLAATTLRNAEALRLAEASANRLLQAMMEEIRKELQKESSYSQQAVLSATEKGAMRPVALNRRV